MADAITLGKVFGTNDISACSQRDHDWISRRSNFQRDACFGRIDNLDPFKSWPVWNGNSHPEELNAVLRAALMLRRTKEGYHFSSIRMFHDNNTL